MTPTVGTSVARREDPRLLRGEGSFLADLVGDALQFAFVRSTRASASIVDIDLTGALASPGVVSVLDGATFARMAGPLEPIYLPNPRFVEATGFRTAPLRVDAIAVDRVRYVGEPVAVVVATDRYLAEDAAERVEVEYRDLPGAFTAADALADGAPPVRPDCAGNVAASLRFAKGTVPDGPVVVEGSYRMGRHSGVPLETRGVIADFDLDTATVHLVTSSQIPHLVRTALCRAAGWPRSDLRVSVPDVGGGFGTKANIYGEELVGCVLARYLRRRVAWVEDRAEHLVATAHSRDRRHTNRLVLDHDGRILGYADDFVVDLGAHNFWLGGVTANSAIHGLGPYRIPAFDVTGRAVLTNKTPTTQYRGAGRPEACFAMERLLDRAASVLGLSRVEIRRRNLITAAELPYEVGALYHDGQPIVYDGGDYLALLDRCVAEVERIDLDSVSRKELRDGERLGTGYAMFAEGTGLGPYEVGRVVLLASGRFEVSSGAASAGQGHETTLAQVAADELRVPLEAVRVTRADTGVTEDGIGTYASRSAANAGPAVAAAAGELVADAKQALGRRRGAHWRGGDVRLDEFGFFHPETDTKVTWEELALALAGERQEEAGDAPVLERVHTWRPDTVTWTAGAHAAVVAVDDATGFARVLRYVGVDEGGRSLHPSIVEGQVMGGVAQAIGGALFERFEFDPTGQPLTTTLMDYLLPATTDVPRIRLAHVEVPSTMNPLGVRGVGESGIIPGYAAIASAADDATGGRTHLDGTPLDPTVLRRAP
ncbi:xanthine dehydrogenase family protein molybdopterin-binding subunit [Actinophytocola sp.]|uniref:xanthine dehydrogenase family protein molybdopterin-binding subunit n=1 Tax=Actinophytocola sp. TaxID=1872138 RepID=UPI003D6AF0A1